MPVVRVLAGSIVAVLVAAGCAGDQAERAALAKRVRALEKTVDKLRDRTRELERRQEELAAENEELGATQSAIRRRQGTLEGKLESKLESDLVGKADPDRKRPSPDVVYAVPLHDSPALGPKVAKVTLVATVDYTERHSRQLWPLLTRLTRAFGNDLRIVFKSFVVNAEGGVAAARAACAAAQQDRYVEMAELLFEQQDGDWSDDRLRELAGELWIDQAKWEAAFTGAACKAAVERDQRELEALGQYAVPASWINGRFVSGAQAFEKLKQLVEDEVARADVYLDKRGARLERYYTDLVKTGAKAP